MKRHVYHRGRVVKAETMSSGMVNLVVLADDDDRTTETMDVPMEVARGSFGENARVIVEIGPDEADDGDTVSRAALLKRLREDAWHHDKILATDGIPERYGHTQASNALHALIRDFTKEST